MEYKIWRLNINTQFKINNNIDVHITSNGNWHYVSIYNDFTDKSVSYQCGTKELKGLADFIYNTIGEKK